MPDLHLIDNSGDPTYAHIAAELAAMVVEDQAMRRGPWDSDVDRRNTARLKEIVAEIGWPAVSKVGAKAAHDAWLLVQHADLDRPFQRRCLELMHDAGDDVDRRNLAYLEDRVRVGEGRPQIYGTQYWPGPDGTSFEPQPIEDPDHLDERRSAMGMEPHAEYDSFIRRVHTEGIEAVEKSMREQADS